MGASPSQPTDLSAAEGTRQSTIGLIIQSASTLALLSAATYFFGYQFNAGYYSAFGIPVQMLDLPAPSHFLASYRLLSMPVLILCFVGFFPAIGALLLWTTRTEPKRRVIDNAMKTLLIASIFVFSTLCAISLAQMTGNIAAVSLGVVVLLLLAMLLFIRPLTGARDPVRYAIASAAHLGTQRPTLSFLSATIVAVVALVLAGSYARAMAEADAHSDMIADTSNLSEVVLYSEAPLAIPHPTVISSPPGPTLFKYDGLRLVIFTDDRYYTFRPSEVRQERPVIFVVPEASLRQADLRYAATSTPTPTPIPGSPVSDTATIPSPQPPSSPTH